MTLSHPFDYLRWLFGEVRSVLAFTANRGSLELDVEDTAEIGLCFENGLLGSLHLDYNQRPSAHWLEVIGSDGILRWDNSDGAVSVWRMPETEEPLGSRTGRQISPAMTGKIFERNEMFLAEMSHFVDVVRGSASPACTLSDGLQALRLAVSALISAQTGRLVDLADR